MIELNKPAPDFSLPGSDGKTHTLKEFRGKYLVLYFYPRDNTPGCTIEAKHFTAKHDKLRALGAEVVGVSDDDLKSHDHFIESCSLDLLLLSDTGHKMIENYDSYKNKGAFGWGTERNTFVIDGKGIVVQEFKRVQPLTHDGEVIAFLESLKK